MQVLKRKNRPTPSNVFDFNHTDPALSKGTVEMKLYAFYHKKHWGYDKLFRAFQRRNLFCNVVTGKAIISSAIAGDITLNPAVFAALTGFGLVIKTVASFKKHDKKAEKANFARVEYKKILYAITFHFRGEPFDERDFLEKLKMIDDFVSDPCMEILETLQAK